MNLNFCLPKFWVIALFLIHSWLLSGAYLKSYTSYVYEILWVNRSHQGRVQCMWTLTLACLISELLPLVYFHTWILSGAYLQNYTSYGYEISWMVITWGETGLFCDNLPLLFTLLSTNVDQSALNLVKMYVMIRSRLSSIMDLIGPELSELSVLELENLPYLTWLIV